MCNLCNVNNINILFEDNDIIIKRKNNMNELILLIGIIKKHNKQENILESIYFKKLIKLLKIFGNNLCKNGFRISINFGPDALQFWDHEHILLSGGKVLSGY